MARASSGTATDSKRRALSGAARNVPASIGARAAVSVDDRALHLGGPSAQVTHRCRQSTLGRAQQGARGGRDHRGHTHVGGLREGRRQHRERPPRQREPQVRVERAAEQLQVVGHHEERAGDDEDAEPGRDLDHAVDAERDGAREPRDGHGDEHGARDSRAERTPVQLVERVRREPHRQEERQQGLPQPSQLHVGGERGTDHDVGEMPQRVRGVQQGPPVPPPAGRHRVEGGPRRARVALSHADDPAFTPHITTAAPSVSSRDRTWRMPASCHHRTCSGNGARCSRRLMLGPRKLPVCRHCGETNDPSTGSTPRV